MNTSKIALYTNPDEVGVADKKLDSRGRQLTVHKRAG